MPPKQPRSWSPCKIKWEPFVNHDTTNLTFSSPSLELSAAVRLFIALKTTHFLQTDKKWVNVAPSLPLGRTVGSAPGDQVHGGTNDQPSNNSLRRPTKQRICIEVEPRPSIFPSMSQISLIPQRNDGWLILLWTHRIRMASIYAGHLFQEWAQNWLEGPKVAGI